MTVCSAQQSNRLVCVFVVAVVGLTSATYTGSEEQGCVSIGVGVLEGELGYPVTIQLTTASGTADSMYIIQ